ncbi:MAG: hypothetical protein QCI82_04090, partial [Candidatus Thermoplasmatota archaeon]|nr:hypothetical protein [Candidatus Thermoplasmatota archaeon]
MLSKGPSITDRIRELLHRSEGEPWSPWEIARILEIKRTTAKSILHRLRVRGEISYYRRGRSRDIPGFYTWSLELQERNKIEALDSGP